MSVPTYHTIPESDNFCTWIFQGGVWVPQCKCHPNYECGQLPDAKHIPEDDATGRRRDLSNAEMQARVKHYNDTHDGDPISYPIPNPMVRVNLPCVPA